MIVVTVVVLVTVVMGVRASNAVQQGRGCVGV
jgi:hypothetical protein